jgi:hypothetical protein
MRLHTKLLVAATLACLATPSWADNIYCVSAVYADKTNVCVGETVNISIDSTICSNGWTVGAGTNYSQIFTNTGVNVISNWCSACGEASSVAFVAITVGQLDGITRPRR